MPIEFTCLVPAFAGLNVAYFLEQIKAASGTQEPNLDLIYSSLPSFFFFFLLSLYLLSLFVLSYFLLPSFIGLILFELILFIVFFFFFSSTSGDESYPPSSATVFPLLQCLLVALGALALREVFTLSLMLPAMWGSVWLAYSFFSSFFASPTPSHPRAEHCPIELPEMLTMFYICMVQIVSYQPHVAFECLKYG